MGDPRVALDDASPERESAFLPLGDPGITRHKFGAKAAILSRLVESVRVPHGYALDLVCLQDQGRDLMQILTEVHGELKSNGRPLIVRSSATMEDQAPALFPGRFASLRDLNSVNELYEGVEECIDHAAQSQRVRDYYEAHGLGNSRPLTSLLIQEQIPADYGGVVFTRAPRPYHDFHALIELIDGSASDLLAGKALGGLYGVEPGPVTERYTQLAGPPHQLGHLTKLLDAVMLDARKAERILGEPQDIEWVWSDDRLYVVQARPARILLPARNSDEAAEAGRRIRDEQSALPPLPLARINDVGQKAAASIYFNRLGCGVPNMQMLLPTDDADKVAAELEGRKIGEHGTVVRFSSVKEATAGLPVGFVAAEDDLPTVYVRLREQAGKAPHAGIVSDYMFVEHAFEAYVDAEWAIVEHVPGNWEPQNDLRPDVIVFEKDAVHAWRVTEKRQASFELPSAAPRPAALLRDVDPIGDDVIKVWASELPTWLQKFRRKFRENLPLNFHFVHVDGNWHFLNIRPTRDLPVTRSPRTPRSEFKRRRLFLVTAADDLGSWDGAAPILITLTADMPDEERIAQLGRALHDHGVETVYTSFGVLSHPALVLREFGLDVQPMYDYYEFVPLPGPR